MTTVTGTVLRPTGEPVVNAQVIIDLVASVDDEGAPGYVPADLTEVWAKTVVRTDDAGVWEADLPPTAGGDNVYSQTGVVYSVIYRISRREQGIHYIDVPASGAALWVGGLLVEQPSDIPSAAGAPSGASYLVATTAGLPNEVVVGATPGGQLGGTWSAPTVDTLHAGGSHVASSISFTPAGTIAATNVQAALEEVALEAGGGSSAPTTADYLVGTAQGGLSAEIVVGTTPGGELGGTWASPTVDATHSGSSHAGIQAAAEATAAGALSSHVAASDPHPVYLTAAEGNAAYDAAGAAAARAPADVNYYVGTASGSLSAEIPIGTTSTDGHVLRRAGGSLGFGAVDLADTDAVTGLLPAANIDSAIARDSETTAAIAALSSVYQPLDATLTSVAAYNTNGLLAQTAADTFAGRTITGTANRLSVSNGDGVSGNPTLNIDTGYLGQTSITTLGTIGTGVWNGTTVAVANGGTGGTSQATAQTALNVPPVADVNSSGAVIKVRGNAVDSGTPNFGQAYVWDGDSFNPTSVTQQVISDAGQQTIGTNNSKTSMFAGTKPIIAASTLAVGDTFQIVGAGSFETVGGAASTLKIDWDLINPTPATVNIATITSASVGVTKLVNVRFQIDALVTAIGSSATIMVTMTLSVSANSTTLVDVLINHVLATGPATVNSTVALTHDLSLTCSANNASNTWSTILLNGTYTPKFA